MTKIRDTLVELNPWWKGEFSLEYRQREVYREIQRFIALPQIVALTGLRRAGKTTLMLKLAEDAMKKGFDPKDILYFSFDEFRDAQIRDILSEYETLLGRHLDTKRHLILLDEIQKLGGWGDQLKAVYDRYRKNVKIVVSGSESLFIRKGARETLAGRLFELRLSLSHFVNISLSRRSSISPWAYSRKSWPGCSMSSSSLKVSRSLSVSKTNQW